jgi:hypothetical protein
VVWSLHINHRLEQLVLSIPERKQRMVSLILKMSVSLDGYVASLDGSRRHEARRDLVVRESGSVARGRLHSSRTGVVEPDADASYVAEAVVRCGRAKAANAIVGGRIRPSGLLDDPRRGIARLFCVHGPAGPLG